ncbi:hypothetical protein [Streptomyces sp. NPDC059009]|uniref:hypothetical protein n=1 Tax=Streptomyces sp. NPDC059009 TaxID=3346694 RepID=UPI00369C7B0F
MPTRDFARLADAVKARRLELGPLARKKAAEQAGLSKDTWQRVEEAKPVRDMTYAKIDPVLGWARGSCVAITEGGRPVHCEASVIEGVSIATTHKGDLGEEVEQAIHTASIATTELTAREIRELSAHILGVLRRRGVI